MIHEDDIHKIQIALAEIDLQLKRLIADAESEKETRKERNRDIDHRLIELELWKSNINGRLIVTVCIGGALWTAFVGWVFSLLNK